MRRLTIFLAVILTSGAAFADHAVKGYTRKDGTYVAPHISSDPDAYRYNNHSSESRGGAQHDEYSSGGGATNKRNSAYGAYDNDRDGIVNPYDPAPESKRNCTPGAYGC